MSYKQWAFNFFITIISLNILTAILVVQTNPFKNYVFQINAFALMAIFFLIFGIILGIISYLKKEETDYKKKLGLYGNLAILVLSIILQVFGDV